MSAARTVPQRLQQRAQFQALLRGPALVHTAHFALHGLATAGLKGSRGRPLFTGPGPWLGAVVPKRWARRAVTRNTLKRQIAAAAAEWPLPPGAWLVRLRRAFAPAEYPSATSAALRHAVRAELRELLGVRLPQWLASGRRLPSALDGSGTAGVARADARRTASSARAALERGEVA